MAKKRARRRTTRRVRRTTKKSVRRSNSFVKQADRYISSTSRRINIALSNLFLFLVLAIISYMLYKILNNSLFISLFSLLTIIFAFVALAFFITLLVFIALRFAKKEEEIVYPNRKKPRRRHKRR
ncbi:MAG TPA: hypothetical protein VMC80_00720 [Patescibacteria group bacterium]|nr:hypothetical protein [Patescibacteria group bacterium]